MILSHKSDCIDSIINVLEKTSVWRKGVSEKFEDPRNAKAYATLEKLADEAVNLTDDQFGQLRPYFNWASPAWRDGLFQAARLVGFAHKATGLDSFVRLLVRQFPQNEIAA